MQDQLVPSAVLEKSKKILFIAHLALGDFTYLQNFFKAFSVKYPDIEMHIWVDELRRSSNPKDWVHLKKYALYDWLAACPYFVKTYNKTYSPELYRQSIVEAQQEKYPLVVSLATLRPHLYADLAQKISPSAFLAGMKQPASFFSIKRKLAYRKLSASLSTAEPQAKGSHITATYNNWFRSFFGVHLTEPQRHPNLAIPTEWILASQQQLANWGIFVNKEGAERPIFINPFAKNNKRCWPLSRVIELIQAMQKLPAWSTQNFLVNVVPEELEKAKSYFSSHHLERVQLFSAEDNFFQLPAMLSQCRLIISVETAVMHLANAVHVPVFALMRQKNPEWAPIDQQISTVLTTQHRGDWVKSITANEVIEALSSSEIVSSPTK